MHNVGLEEIKVLRFGYLIFEVGRDLTDLLIKLFLREAELVHYVSGRTFSRYPRSKDK